MHFLSVVLTPILYILSRAAAPTNPNLSATKIPSYVLEYGKTTNLPHLINPFLPANTTPAPLIWLHSQDPYRPSDIAQQLVHTTPLVDWKPVQGAPSPLTLNNLDSLNEHGNTSVFLTSKEGIDANPQPEWVYGVAPDEGERAREVVSSVIITREGVGGVVDAFYFYFYA